MIATNATFDAVIAKLEDVKKNGSGMKARCPAHEDDSPSLRVSIGDEGRVLLHCYAGCETEKILKAMGLEFRDLYPPELQKQFKGKGPDIYLSAKRYDYVDEDGTLLYQVERRDFVNRKGKAFVQRRPTPGGEWVYELGDVRRVLYRLPEIRKAIESSEYILLPEGEKDVDRLIKLGFNATTNAMGAGKGKWRPEYSDQLAGADVILIPDNDEAGYGHMLEVARSLEGKAASVSIIQIVVVPKKGDISDYIELMGEETARRALDATCSGGAESEAGLKAITIDELAILAEAPADPKQEPADDSSYPHILDVPEFPVDVFPQAIREYVEKGSASLGVAPDMIAVPLLVFAAGAIGNSFAIAVKPDWIERPNLWGGVIGPPGSAKSPAIRLAHVLISALQREAHKRYQSEHAEWETKCAALKANKQTDLPEEPTLEHFFTTDATIEGLTKVLAHSPGVAIYRDELVGWVNSFDAYRKAGDRDNYLSLWAGGEVKVDRKGAGTVYIAHPCASVIGGIQPDRLGDLRDAASRHDGFIDRLLLVWPESRPQQWSDDYVDQATTDAAIAVFRRLRLPANSPSDGVLHLTDEAKGVFKTWFNQNSDITAEVSGRAAGCYSKYPSQLARIALVLHCLRRPGETAFNVDAPVIADAIKVIEYFRAHLLKVLPAFGAEGSDKQAGLEARVLRALNKRGVWLARDEIHQALGRKVPAGELNAVLEALAEQGKIENREVPTGARPRMESRSLLRGYEDMRNQSDISDHQVDMSPEREELHRAA